MRAIVLSGLVLVGAAVGVGSLLFREDRAPDALATARASESRVATTAPGPACRLTPSAPSPDTTNAPTAPRAATAAPSAPAPAADPAHALGLDGPDDPADSGAPTREALAADLAVASGARGGDRAFALDQIGRSSCADAATVGEVARLALTDPDAAVRARATIALQQLALGHEELVADTAAALLDVAEGGATVADRMAALVGLRIDLARDREIDRLGALLADPEAEVRAAAAGAVRDVPPAARPRLARALHMAMRRETDPTRVAALDGALARVGR